MWSSTGIEPAEYHRRRKAGGLGFVPTNADVVQFRLGRAVHLASRRRRRSSAGASESGWDCRSRTHPRQAESRSVTLGGADGVANGRQANRRHPCRSRLRGPFWRVQCASGAIVRRDWKHRCAHSELRRRRNVRRRWRLQPHGRVPSAFAAKRTRSPVRPLATTGGVWFAPATAGGSGGEWTTVPWRRELDCRRLDRGVGERRAAVDEKHGKHHPRRFRDGRSPGVHLKPRLCVVHGLEYVPRRLLPLLAGVPSVRVLRTAGRCG